MKRTVLFSSKTSSILVALVLAALAVAGIASARGQNQSSHLKPYFTVRPLENPDMKAIQRDSDAATGLKVWTYHATSTRVGSKGNKYTGMMVGASPYTSKATTTITLQIVPVIFHIAGKTFDPTVADNTCLGGKVPLTLLQQSPMAMPANFKMNGVNVGKEQYIDAYQRANFWKFVSKNGGKYHTKLKIVTLKTLDITPPTSQSGIVDNTGCEDLAGVDINWWGGQLEGSIIGSLKSQGVNPTTFPLFMMYNTVMYAGTVTNCCYLGYHGAFGNPPQTYSPTMFDATGVFGPQFTNTYVMAHEVGEWMDDPFGGNPVPAWGHIGQQGGCQGNLENGDPLTGIDKPFAIKMSNGFTYNLQELAMYSWFYGPPSIGAGGKFSDNGSFTSAQGACQ